MKFIAKPSKGSAIPIVPMLDILTILLIFFIVHTQWKRPQNLLHIDIPKTQHIEGTEAMPASNILSVTPKGEIALNGEILPPDVLIQRLQSLDIHAGIQMNVDERAPFGSLVNLWDIITAAGLDIKEIPAKVDFHP